MTIFIIGLLLILTGGTVSIAAKEEKKGRIFLFFFSAGSLLSAVISILSFFYTFSLSFDIGLPFESVTFAFDPLSSFFSSLILIMGLPCVIYGISYLKSYEGKGHGISSHYFFLGLFFAALALLPVVKNAFFFLVIWEIMSISSFFLVLFETSKEEVRSAALNYLVTMHISVAFLIIGFIILSSVSGSYDFSSFKLFVSSNRYLADTVFVFLFIGFGIKSGIVPFHFWMPKAHPAAPSHVSALMSGLMIKIGIYGILRSLLIIGIITTEMAYLILFAGVITMLYGILNASVQNDIKRLLAYSSIENIGIILTGIGAGIFGIIYNNPFVAFMGFAGGIMHILNHSIFKELLFLSSGSIYIKTHTRNIDELGGLAKKMPSTAILFLIGSLAISGLPPFNGFISEILIYCGLITGLTIHNMNSILLFSIVLFAMALTGTLAMLCFTKVFGIVFQGKPRTEKAERADSDVAVNMLLPKFWLGVLIIIFGLLPGIGLFAAVPVVKIFTAGEIITDAVSFSYELLSAVSLVSLGLIALFLLVFFLRKLIVRNRTTKIYKTWGCGYQAGNPKMQYTAYSFIEPFAEMFRNVFVKERTNKAPQALFPAKGSFKLIISDMLEAYFAKPLVHIIRKFLGKFLWIQNGSTQIYILYGFVFLVLAIIGIFFHF